MPPSKKTVFLSSISSDIGIALAKRYAEEGYRVAGTYRSKELLSELKSIPNGHLFYCDLTKKESIRDSIEQYAKIRSPWETFISCAAWPPPLTSFFVADFEEWSESVHVNAVEQFRVLHGLYPLRDQQVTNNVIFFAGPGSNNAVKNFSALSASKQMLIKMCELLDAENENLNVFIIGPGWTKTKTHDQIINDPHVSKEKHKETMDFMKNRRGTSMDDIYGCIRWLSRQGRMVAGGRNFSVVHDLWGTDEMADELRKDPNMYKMRRFKNEWRDKGDPKI